MESEVHVEEIGWWKSPLSSELSFHYKHSIPTITDSILVLIAIPIAVVGQFLASRNPCDLTQINLSNSYLPPFWPGGGKMSSLLRTDEQGKDILSAIIYGSTSSIMTGLVGMAASRCIGTTLGLIVGYFGGKMGAVIMRIADIQLSLPSMLIVPFVMSVLGRDVGKLLIALTMVRWVTYARTIRGETLSVKGMEYAEAARTVSLSGRIIIIRHMLPNVVNSIIVLVIAQTGNFILTEVTLSFLGVDVLITQPSLGLLVKTGFDALFSGLRWTSVFSGLYIMFIVFGINLLGDFLRDKLNPNLK